MDFAWERLPEPVLEGLCVGGTGKLHLMRLAGLCLNAGSETGSGGAPLRALGLDLLRAAFEADPLDAPLAGQLLALAPEALSGPELGPLLAALEALRIQAARPNPTEQNIERLAARGDLQHACEAASAALAQDPGNPRLLRPALDLAWRSGRAAWAAALLEAPWPTKAEPLRRFALGNTLFFLKDYERAREAYAGACALPLPLARWRLGECLLRLGERQAAQDTWLTAHRERPWNINLLLRAHDAALGLDTALRPLDGRLAVLLYTWNKARFLDATLAAVFGSELAGAHVFVLNNGSTDDSAEVISAWQGRVGEGRMTRLDLPVNVGAPAARNWLASLPAVAACRYAAFLDDDALPPPDWVSRLGAAVEAYPMAGVYGCKVVDVDNPACVQNADLHIRPGASGEPRSAEAGNGLALSDLHLLEPDCGQFDYLRPCVSVTGCCHLFRTRILADCGGFDIALSPSQFDDLEHDLRLNLKGRPAVYQGHLSVRHARRTGEQTRSSSRAAVNGHSNWAKIERLYPRREIREIAGNDHARLLEDLRRKTEALGPEWLAGSQLPPAEPKAR
ncbi:MAG: glycosyltransferase [Humidesulfovibrio sp.]|nr:glycosyltransferase [Humidesulfovibrio sp.]